MGDVKRGEHRNVSLGLFSGLCSEKGRNGGQGAIALGGADCAERAPLKPEPFKGAGRDLATSFSLRSGGVREQTPPCKPGWPAAEHRRAPSVPPCLPGGTVLPLAGTKRARWWPRVLVGREGRSGLLPKVAKGGLLRSPPALPQPFSLGLSWLRSPALHAAGVLFLKIN